MISSQKIVAMIIGINIMLGIILTAIETDGTTDPDFTSIDTIRGTIDKEEENAQSEEGVWGSIKSAVSKITEATIGNIIKWGLGLYNILKLGFNPWSISPSDYTNQIEILMARILLGIRSFITALLLFELYVVFKNKKAT